MPRRPRSRPSAASRWAAIRAPGTNSIATANSHSYRSFVTGPSPYSQDANGFVYLHSRIAYSDIAQFQRGHITFDELSIRFEIKLGHTNNLRRRFKEYKKCTDGYLFFWHLWNAHKGKLQSRETRGIACCPRTVLRLHTVLNISQYTSFFARFTFGYKVTFRIILVTYLSSPRLRVVQGSLAEMFVDKLQTICEPSADEQSMVYGREAARRTTVARRSRDNVSTQPTQLVSTLVSSRTK
ncbi:hypothetical protein R3P38DRAFT_3175577 [Favolaschia claudopus]|uniref:Uncharacterized protein n=1 Tax=Favolaschia claudopus TaxID=2862362 RepID=A0AAW0D5A6_9AGAR